MAYSMEKIKGVLPWLKVLVTINQKHFSSYKNPFHFHANSQQLDKDCE